MTESNNSSLSVALCALFSCVIACRCVSVEINLLRLKLVGFDAFVKRDLENPLSYQSDSMSFVRERRDELARSYQSMASMLSMERFTRYMIWFLVFFVPLVLVCEWVMATVALVNLIQRLVVSGPPIQCDSQLTRLVGDVGLIDSVFRYLDLDTSLDYLVALRSPFCKHYLDTIYTFPLVNPLLTTAQLLHTCTKFIVSSPVELLNCVDISSIYSDHAVAFSVTSTIVVVAFTVVVVRCSSVVHIITLAFRNQSTRPIVTERSFIVWPDETTTSAESFMESGPQKLERRSGVDRRRTRTKANRSE